MAYLLRVDTRIQPDRHTATAHVLDGGTQPASKTTGCFILSLVFDPTPADGALFGNQFALTHVGKVPVGSGKKSATAGRTVRALDLESIGEPLPIATLLARVPAEARGEITTGVQNRGVQLNRATVRALIAALRELRPQIGDVLDWLESVGDEQRFISDGAAAQWEVDRDKLGVAQRIFGAPTGQHWRRPADDESPYTAGLFSLRPDPIEADAINHDAGVIQAFQRMGENVPGSRQHVKVFRSSEKDRNTHQHRYMQTININASGGEAATGGDLLYYHLQSHSCVVVQYKRLKGRGGSYRVDKQLQGQIDRMAIVSDASGKPESLDDWRLGADSCFVKLIEPHGRVDPTDTGMIDGRYIPLSYLQILLALGELRGDGDSLRINTKSIRHLTNSLFIGLVREGWLGTCGVGIEDLENYCKARLKERESLLIAVDQSPETPYERIARSRRRG